MQVKLKALDQITAWIIGILVGVLILGISLWFGKRALFHEEAEKVEIAKSAEEILENSRKHKKDPEKSIPDAIRAEDKPLFDSSFEGAFSYTGTTAPWRWSDLRPSWSSCQKGKFQSPIDIVQTRLDEKLKSLKPHYSHDISKFSFSNQTLVAEIPQGSWLEVDGERLNLMRAFFRTPSEHRVQSLPYEMEIQLQHIDPSGQILFLSVLATVSKKSNDLLENISKNLPRQEGETTSLERINWSDLLPHKKTYWTYNGSLTYPPCSEKTSWIIFTQQIEVAKSVLTQYELLQKNNARPPQSINKRSVSRSNR